MRDRMVKTTLNVSGMVCAACAARIEKRLAREPGVAGARVDYAAGVLTLEHDPAAAPLSEITRILDGMDYAATEAAAGGRRDIARSLGTVLILLGVAYAGSRLGILSLANMFPEAEAGMGLGMIFLTGVLTSVHCLAMCGGINLSQTALAAPAGGAGSDGARGSLTRVLPYAAGRVLSYTAIGGVIGGVGAVFSLSAAGKAGIQLAAGAFMVLMGLNLMGLFPGLRRFIPALPRFFGGDASGAWRRGPFLVGLLNGFMPCGPLQAMQLFALSAGSPVRGAAAMLAFSLGTLPLTMGLGVFAARLGKRFMGKAIRVGAALVFLMGLSMLGSALSLAGVVVPGFSGGGDVVEARAGAGRQTLETALLPDAFPPVRVRAGVPLVWTIHADASSLNGCNNRILIPGFGVERKLVPGENVIEFTPDAPGIYPYMCWMGMIVSRIIVGDVEDSGETPAFDPSVLPEPDGEYIEDVPWL